MARLILAIVLAAAAGLGSHAAVGPDAEVRAPGHQVVHSRSGQFVVIAPPDLTFPRPSPGDATNRSLNLTPEFAAVSCERIKESLLRELGMRDVLADATIRGAARISISLLPPADSPRDLAFAATRYTDGWDYRLQMPARLEAESFVRGVLHVFLLACANRMPGANAAEIPAWLTEGLSRHLEAVNPIELVLERPSRSGNRLPLGLKTREQGRDDPLQEVRRRLRLVPALSFTELSLPPTSMEAAALEHYRDSAQVFVAELIKSREGREGLRRTMDLLTQHLNWQTAFFRAFAPRFERPIDVEKWWALTLVSFTGRDPGQAWSNELALRKLEETLRIPMELRSSVADMPHRQSASLQQVVMEWDRVQQRMALQIVIRQLAAIQLKLPGDLASLAEDYRLTLAEFVEQRSRSGYAAERKGDVPLTSLMLARQVVRHLDDLDRRKAELVANAAVVQIRP